MTGLGDKGRGNAANRGHVHASTGERSIGRSGEHEPVLEGDLEDDDVGRGGNEYQRARERDGSALVLGLLF